MPVIRYRSTAGERPMRRSRTPRWPKDSTFVRGLWGSTEIERFRTKTLADVRRALDRPYRFPFVTYVFGRQNLEFLTSLGVRAKLLAEEPLVNWRGQDGPVDTQYGRVAYGVSAWRHKLAIIRQALTEYRQVIWADWDTRALAPIPRDFWQRMQAGAPIQVCIRQYKRIKCPWRHECKRTLGSGAFIYCRDRSIVDRVLAINDENPGWDDEICIMRAIDEHSGGWHGLQAYRERGYNPWCYHIFGAIFEPEQRLFTAS